MPDEQPSDSIGQEPIGNPRLRLKSNLRETRAYQPDKPMSSPLSNSPERSSMARSGLSESD